MTNQLKLTAHGMRTGIGRSCRLLPLQPGDVLHARGWSIVPCHKEGTTSLPETRDHLWSSGATQIVIRQTLGMVKDNTGLGPRGPGVSRIAKALLTRGRTSAASCLRQPPGTRHSEA